MPGRDDFLLLSLIPLGDRYRNHVAAACATVFPASIAEADAIVSSHGSRARAVLTNGAVGLSSSQLDRLPCLELVCILGAGYEGVDLDAARRRGIRICHGPGTNTEAVADHALGLLLSLTRAIPRLDRKVREGGWKDEDEHLPILARKNLGIFGLGRIGSAIADRARGFGVTVGYTNRRRRDGTELPWFPSLAELAAWSDFLVISAPGTPDTFHVVDQRVLSALGARGYLVNVGRGSSVDTAALIDALESRKIAGAALDVFEDEPNVPERLLSLPNVVLTPHAAGRSPESRDAMIELLVRNIELHRAGKPLSTPL